MGAGCSVSSGIPAAGSLVNDHWLPRLKDICAPKNKSLVEWAAVLLSGYDPKSAASYYGIVMEKLFLLPEDRQREIESLCDGRFPGFGYAALAGLMENAGGRFNVVLTTNFDDLVADSLYLFTESRPLVIHHESLANFIRPTRTRPIVVKLHGDHRLSPMNTVLETNALKKEIKKQVQNLVYDRGLIFLGYGGNDQGIANMFEDLPAKALPWGVFWVSGSEPKGRLRKWLDSRDAFWIEKQDFDEFMLIMRNTFDLPHPDPQRIDHFFERYYDTYRILSNRIHSLPDEREGAVESKEALAQSDEALRGWPAIIVAARKVRATDPNKAEELYENGLKEYPRSAALLSSFAIFLAQVRKQSDKAEYYFRKAIAADPKNATVLENYAIFLKASRRNYDEAERYYRRAIDADPSATKLGNYAIFLSQIRKNHDKAEDYYRRAIAADPYSAHKLGNFAGFLLGRNKRDEGLAMLERVLASKETSELSSLAVECWFYAVANGMTAGRLVALQKLKKLLIDGARSPGWDFTLNIDRAREEGHPDLHWLEKLASVISEDSDINQLQTWEEWKRL